MRIHFYSIHGLFRGHDLEIGRDSDNGGQIIYVMELAKALSLSPRVTSVHLFTRLLKDEDNVSADYAEPIERITDKFDIRRIPCGDNKYVLKEQLWPLLDEFVSNTIQHITSERILPDWLHSHYADAGYVAAEISAMLNVPFAHSAHSLGKRKLKGLLRSGVSRDEAMRQYHFDKRFDAEEMTLANAEFVVTSSRQEIAFFDDYENARLSEYHCIPPGIDFERFYPYYEQFLPNNELSEEEKQSMLSAQMRIERFLSDPNKPQILSICRPNKTKNIDGLIRAYGEDPELQALANLVIYAGIRSDIETMKPNEKEALTQILLLMDKYNLYGKLAIPKKHEAKSEVPEIYRLAARRQGVFTNLALHEQFGLTLLEATACGLPVVATQSGGPAEIVPNCDNGILVDPRNTAEIQAAFKELLTDRETWQKHSNQGIQNVQDLYNWKTHAEAYLDMVKSNLDASQGAGIKNLSHSPRVVKTLKSTSSMFVTDIDGTLLSETDDSQPGLDEMQELLRNRESRFVFAVASGRSVKLIRKALTEAGIPPPDIAIASVGTEIYYGLENASLDKGWTSHISYRWDRDLFERLALKLDELELQEEPAQKPHKISFYTKDAVFDTDRVYDALGDRAQDATVLITRGAYVDIIPKRASKGKAIRYLCQKWGIPLTQTIVAGDSGNDFDMFQISALGIVVGNASNELDSLKETRNVYFSEQESAKGILDGFKRYKFPFEDNN